MNLKRYLKYSLVFILTVLFCFMFTKTFASKQIPVNIYYTFFDDQEMFSGIYSVVVDGEINAEKDTIDVLFNEAPKEFDLGEPFIYLNNAANNSRTKDITDECVYDKVTGIISVPLKYSNEEITLRTTLSTNTKMYEWYIPGCFKGTDFNDDKYPAFGTYLSSKPGFNLRGFIGGYSEGAFTVIPNSSNDIYLDQDISWLENYVSDTQTYSTGNGKVVNVGTYDGNLWKNMQNTGTEAYAGFDGESSGFAVSFYYFDDENLNRLFSWKGIGAPGTGKSVFPTCQSFVDSDVQSEWEYTQLEERNWMYARCVEATSNQFAGDPIFQNATVRFVSISEDKQEVYGLFLVKAKGPGYKNAQDCGFTFKIHGTKKTPPVRPQKTTDASAEYQAKHPLIGTEFTIYTNSACTEVATSSDGSPAVVTITNQGNIGEINLSSGTYWIKETKATNGYELNTQAKQFSVTGSESEPINLEMFNSAAYANLRIQKTGVGNYSVSGAVFEVYEDSNCTTRTKDSNGNFVSISVRNSNGLTDYVEIPKGIKYIKEVTAPAGYNKKQETIRVELVGGHNNTIDIKNELKPGKGKVVKTY